jgi:hypothetical protein
MGNSQSATKELFDKLYPNYDLEGLTGIDLMTNKNYEFVRIGKQLALISNDLLINLELINGYATNNGIEKIILEGTNGDLKVLVHIYYSFAQRYRGWCYIYEQLHPSGKKLFLKTQFVLK